jgi:hypothetical protein
MRDDALQASETENLKPHDGEMRDLSLGAFRFIAAFLVCVAMLAAIAGVL